MRFNWRLLIFVLIAIGMMGSSTWYAYHVAVKPALQDYIGDEVWYVPSSRNVLHRLGMDPHYVHDGYEGINVIFKDETAKLKYRYIVNEALSEYGGNLSATVSYQKFPGLYVEVKENHLNEFLAYLAKYIPDGEYYTVTGYRYPDKDNIQNYLNLEHPFLGKDFIMAGMLLFGDRPIGWRLPGIILFAILQLLVLLAAYRVSRSYLASLIALFFVAVDPTLQATAVAAMLDIYVAFFVALFLLLAVYGRDMWTGVSIGLSSATKLSGAFGYPVFFIQVFNNLRSAGRWVLGRLLIILLLLAGDIVAYAAYYSGFKGPDYYRALSILALIALAEFSLRCRDRLRELVISISALLVLPIVGFLLPEIPAVKVVGFKDWLMNFLGSFKWHLSYKGPNPWTAPFWEWFYNGKSFHFHFNPDVVASTDPALLLFMVVAIFAIPYVWRRKGAVLVPFGIFWSTVALFALQYALGGKTQFSFYATALVPEAAVVTGVVVNEIVKWEAFTESLLDYLYWLGKLLHVGRFVRYVEDRRKPEEGEEVAQEPFPFPIPSVYANLDGLPKRREIRVKRREPRPGGLPKKEESSGEKVV